jgi:uncharacterized small protein (DUF1192 family)
MCHSAAVVAQQHETLRRLLGKEALRLLSDEVERRDALSLKEALARSRYERKRKRARRRAAHQRWLESLPEEIRFTLRIHGLNWWDGPSPQPRSVWPRINRMVSMWR